MHTRLRLAAALFAAVTAVSCGDFGRCLHADCRAIDSIYANVRLCGFPLSQIDRSSEFSRSHIRQGQRIPLELKGKLDLVRTIEWSAGPRIPSGQPIIARLVPTSRTTAVLEGLTAGGEGPTGDWFVGASLTFQDGTDGWAPVAHCRGDDWIPATGIVVRP